MTTEAIEIACFKAYDVRGRVPDQLNETIAYRIGRGYAAFLKPSRVVVGHDIRNSSVAITDALVEGLRDSGVDVMHVGICGTEEIYFSTFYYQTDGGIVVTASHNPMDYNGLKMVREQSKPISVDSGLVDIRFNAERGVFPEASRRGTLTTLDHRDAYIAHLLTYVDAAQLKPLTLVVNSGNGCAGAVVDALAKHLPFEIVRVHHEPDGDFPNGVPNPLLPENRVSTSDAIRASGADLGIAFDGDFDRCFFFDDQGGFVEGYYIVGLLAEAFLGRHAGSRIVHDPRLKWNTMELVAANGGIAVETKAGHAFIKERMRNEDAIYGGEMSAHHYFRDFSYCDSGMIPWLLIVELMSRKGSKLSELLGSCMTRYPASGEINRVVDDAPALLADLEARYGGNAVSVEHVDGLSVEFEQWRFNLRMSNTEPVVRLNVESRGDIPLMRDKTAELLGLIGGEAG